jgi:hypothetical protein
MSRRSLLTALSDTAGAVALAPPSRPRQTPPSAGLGGIGRSPSALEGVVATAS